VCCEYPNRTPRTSAVVLQCSHIPVTLSPCYKFCFSALHTSQTPASVSAGNGVDGPVFVFSQVGAGGTGCGDNGVAGSVFIVIAVIAAVTVSVAAAAAATVAVFVLVVVFAAVFAVIIAGVAGVAVLASVAFAAAAAVAIIVIIVITDLLGFEVRAMGTGGSELDGQVQDTSRAVAHGWCHTNSAGFQRLFSPKVGELAAGYN
jgi:hypothetical protein